MRKINYGIIGVGIQGENHIRCLKNNPQVELKAIADINKERARNIVEKYKIRKWYEDYRKLLTDPEIEAVSITTPDFLHKEIVIEAARCGKHILVEKPLATSVKDAREIVNVSRASDVKLMVNFSNRWSPPFRHVKESIDKGELGEIFYAYARLSDTIYVPTKMISWAHKTNVLWFLGSHVIDLLLWYFNDEVIKVYGVSKSKVLNAKGVATPDFYQAILEFKRGSVATVECSWILPLTYPFIVDFKIEVVGSKGAVNVDRSHHGAVRKADERGYTYPDILYLPHIGVPIFLYESINEFVKCVLEDKEPPIKVEDGLKNVIIIDAIMRSATEGRAITLEY